MRAIDQSRADGNADRPAPVLPGTRHARGPIVLLAFFIALLFLDPPGSWLLDPDETRYAEIPREMLASGDFLTPRLNGSHYFQKPPLLYWANAASIAVFGENPFAARLPVRLAAIGTAVLLALGIAGSLTPGAPAWAVPGTGSWAALAYLSSDLSFSLGRFNILDGLLTLALTLTLLSLRDFLRLREAGLPARRPLVLLGMSVGLAVLTKGLVGIVIPGLVFLIWVAVMGRWRRVIELLFSPAPIVLLAIATPWFVLVEQANPGFSRFFFIHEHLQRYATNAAARGGPAYYFVIVFFLGFLPWTLFLGRALAPLRPPRLLNLRAHGDELLLFAWIVVIVLFFSVSQSKLVPYALPAFPAAALLAGRAVAISLVHPDGWMRRMLVRHAVLWSVAAPGCIAAALHAGRLRDTVALECALAGTIFLLTGAWTAVVRERRGRAGLPAALAGWAGLILTLVISLPNIAASFSGHDLALAARRSGATEVVAYRCFLPSFPWVMQRPVPAAQETGELGSAGDYPPDLFWGRDEFWRRWNSKERLAVLVRRQDSDEFQGPWVAQPSTLAENDRYIVLTNFTPTAAGRGDGGRHAGRPGQGRH